MAGKKFLKWVGIFFRIIMGAINAVLKTVFLDLFKNIGFYMLIAFKPEERMKIKNKIDAEKKIAIVEDRLGVIERLVYAVYNDPEYTKRDEGKYDLKELSKKVKK